MAISEISVSKIYILATEPTNKIKDRFWFDTTNNLLKRYDGTTWKPISVSSDDVVVLSSGNKISLTSYLNTQIATLAEGIDSKQDKLQTFTESKDSSSHWKSSIEAEEIELKTGIDGNIAINGPINHRFRVDDDYVYTLTKYRTTDADFYTDYGSRFIEVQEAYSGAGDTSFTIRNNTLINGNLTTQGNASAVDITASDNINYSGLLLKDGVDVLASKQNSTDTTLNTTDKTIVGAINELLASINTNVITSTEQKRITTTSSTAGIQMSTTAKACMVSINPVKTNVGAIYISTSSDTPPTINPLYPDQMPKYKFPDASQVYIWSDVNGDSVDLTIEYYG